ncbi:hypothetical protein RY27_13945, partial [Litorilinea aerophila]
RPTTAGNGADEILDGLGPGGGAGPHRLFEPESRRGRPAAMQVSLFADTHPVVEALRRLDINGLTPLDALNRLYELQKMVE